MLKKTVQFENWDGDKEEKTLHFNLTRSELMDNLDLEDELRNLQTSFSGDQRDLSREEITQILNLVKRIAKLSYGVRDGDRFKKSDELWEAFTQTAAYDSFLFGLFENPEDAMGFLVGVIPKNLREEAEKLMAEGGHVIELPKIEEQIVATELGRPLTSSPGQVVKPAPDDKDVREMSREELMAAYKVRMQSQTD